MNNLTDPMTMNDAFEAMLSSEDKFVAKIKDMIKVVRKEEARPRGIFSEGSVNVYLVNGNLWDKLIKAYNLLDFRQKLDKELGFEEYNKSWKEVVSTVQEALDRKGEVGELT